MSRLSAQLFAFASATDSSKFYYGEFVDNHIMIGSRRALYTSNLTIVPISDEWRAFLDGKKIDFEYKKPGCSESLWNTRTIHGDKLKYMLQHVSGYIIPLFCSIPEQIYTSYPCMSTHPPTVMPKQVVKPPSIVVAAAAPSRRACARAATTRFESKKKIKFGDEDSEAEAVIDSDEEDVTTIKEWKQARKALSQAVSKSLKK
jgi:hypothetical protein